MTFVTRPRSGIRELANQSALYGLAGAAGKALGLLTVPVLTRLLSPQEYGLADLAITLAAVLVVLTMFAGDVPAARLAARADSHQDRRVILSTYVWTTGVISVAVAGLLLPLASLIAANLWSAPDSVPTVLLAVVLIPISAVQASLVNTQRIDLQAKKFAVLSSIDLLAQMALSVAFVAFGWGAFGLVLGSVIGSLVGLGVAASQAGQQVGVKPSAKLAKDLFVEGVPFLPASVGFLVASYGVRFLLVAGLGQDAVGLFAVSFRIASGMALVTAAFSMAWGPFGLSLPDDRDTAYLFGRVMRLYGSTAMLVALALGAVAPEIIGLISGQTYSGAAVLLPGLLGAEVMAACFFVLLVAAGVSRRGHAVAVAAVTGAASQLAATALLLVPLGLSAVGIGALLGQAVALLILLRTVHASIHNGGGSLLVLLTGAATSVVVQALNVEPHTTFAFRIALACACAIGAMAVVVPILRRNTLKS